MTRATELQLLVEEVYGKLAVVYHRTSDQAVRSFQSGGMFKAGSGAMYGKGIYATYDLDSQLRPEMINTYGPYIIKAKVNLEKFLILDPEIARRVYPTSPTIEGQLRNVFRSSMTVEQLAGGTQHSDRYSSNLANAITRRNMAWVRSNTRGIVFTGRRDGKVLLAYDPRSVMPMSAAYVPQVVRSSQVQFQPMQTLARELLNPSFSVNAGSVGVESAIRRGVQQLKFELNRSGIRDISGYGGVYYLNGTIPAFRIRLTNLSSDNYMPPDNFKRFMENKILSVFRKFVVKTSSGSLANTTGYYSSKTYMGDFEVYLTSHDNTIKDALQEMADSHVQFDID